MFIMWSAIWRRQSRDVHTVIGNLETTIAWCSYCDRQTTNSLQMHYYRCQLHNSTVTAESDSDLAKTENWSRILCRSPRVKIIMCLWIAHVRQRVLMTYCWNLRGCAVSVARELLQETVSESKAHHFKERKFIFRVISNWIQLMYTIPVQMSGKN